MKKLTSLVIMVLIIQFANAQITFQKTFGGTGFDVGAGVQQTSDGGYIITGFIENYGAGSYDILLIKTNSNGDTIWTRTYGGVFDDGARALQQTSDAGYIITGYSSGGNDFSLLKTDANGNISWTKAYGAANSPEGESVIQTSDGGYFCSGDASQINLIKTDSNGDTLWTRNYSGLGSSRAYSVQQTSDGGYIISGYTQGTSFSADFYLLKLDAGGDSLWTKTYGGWSDEQGRSVKQTSDDGYIIAGKTSFSFGAGGDDVYLIRTDSLGNVEWSRTYGGGADDAAYSVQQTNDGGFIVAGETQSFGVTMTYILSRLMQTELYHGQKLLGAPTGMQDTQFSKLLTVDIL